MIDLDRRTSEGRVHQVLFAIALGLLLALAAWWVLLMTKMVETEWKLSERLIAVEAQQVAAELARRGGPLSAGPIADRPDHVLAPAGTGGVAVEGTGLAVRPSERAARERRERLERRRLMVLGEGSLLLALVGTCVAMLYRLVVAEQRYRRDVEHFLSRVTHEMKTPLAGLKALLQSLAAGQVPAARLPELAALGLRQAERQQHLVENLLAAHRSASGKAPLQLESVALKPELEAFVHHRRESMALPDDRLRLSCPPGIAARADASALLTILENLADNADKYGSRRLDLVVSELDGQVTIEVADDGEGFEPELAESLFEAFRRGVSASSAIRHGTGLGLHISRELAREMGGDLRARSDGPGRGATFTIVLTSTAVPAQDGGSSRARARAS